jgi:hypothetical protein
MIFERCLKKLDNTALQARRLLRVEEEEVFLQADLLEALCFFIASQADYKSKQYFLINLN